MSERNRTEKGADITVSIVMVPPAGAAKAWGHDESGACIQFTGSKDAMLRLYRRLREAGRAVPPAPLVVNTDSFQDPTEIARSECPIHVLPEIAPGSAIAFAPY